MIQDSEIYVSRFVKSGLKYAAIKVSTDEDGITKADGLAEYILTKWLEEKHPDVVAYLKTREQEEKDFRDGLKTKSSL